MKERSFEELKRSLAEAKGHPLETGWDIYRYMKGNIEQMESQEARTLLACYMKMGLEKPSLLHSLMLNIALRMAKRFPDFQFDRFFDMWEYPGIERIIGYVDYYDEKHKFYHIYDNLSRHFVAVDPHNVPQVGGFVEFTPIIPEDGKFKTAVVHMVFSDATPDYMKASMDAFGTYHAVVTGINEKEGTFSYHITSEIKHTPEGTITPDGTAFLGMMQLTEGQEVRLLLFLKRDKDGVKRNYVAKITGTGTGKTTKTTKNNLKQSIQQTC